MSIHHHIRIDININVIKSSIGEHHHYQSVMVVGEFMLVLHLKNVKSLNSEYIHTQ